MINSPHLGSALRMAMKAKANPALRRSTNCQPVGDVAIDRDYRGRPTRCRRKYGKIRGRTDKRIQTRGSEGKFRLMGACDESNMG